jgi:hypothetical protein
VLSIALPLPMIALVVFTRRFDVMGEFANSQLADLTAWVATALVVFLNVILLLQAMGASILFLSYPSKRRVSERAGPFFVIPLRFT